MSVEISTVGKAAWAWPDTFAGVAGAVAATLGEEYVRGAEFCGVQVELKDTP